MEDSLVNHWLYSRAAMIGIKSLEAEIKKYMNISYNSHIDISFSIHDILVHLLISIIYKHNIQLNLFRPLNNNYIL